MFFLRPEWLLLGLLLPLIVLLYFKKKQVLEYRVSCLDFWEEAVREKEGIKVAKIDRYLPLALQLLIGMLLVAAAAGPVWVHAFSGERVTLALDCSLSMRAVDDGVARFSTAKDEMKKIIQSLPGGTRINIVLLKDGGLELVKDASPKQALGAVEKVECTCEPLNAALAERYLEAYPSPVIVVTDKELGWGDRLVRVGGKLDNAGITHASYDYYSGSVSFTIKNYSQNDKDIVTSLWSENQKVDALTVPVQAESEGNASFKAPGVDGVLTVKIENEDMLGEDNVYFVQAGDDGKKNVLLSGKKFFLEKALTAAADIEFERKSAGTEYDNYDVAIIDDGAELSGIPSHIGVWQLDGMTEGESEVKNAVLKPANTPLTDGLQLKNAYIKHAGLLKERKGFQKVLDAGGKPVMAYGLEDGRKTVYSTIDFAETNLVMLPDFPVLVSNIVNWLGSRGSEFAANPPPELITGEINSGISSRRATGSQPLFSELGKIMLAVALILLVVEWEVYRRGL